MRGSSSLQSGGGGWIVADHSIGVRNLGTYSCINVGTHYMVKRDINICVYSYVGMVCGFVGYQSSGQV